MQTFIDIIPDTSGTEARAWAERLATMYMTYAQKKGWKNQMTLYGDSYTYGPARIRLHFEGDGAAEFLQKEAGTHDITYKDPLSGARLTTFAKVEVPVTGPVRSYVLDPYMKVIDHKRGLSTPKVEEVLAGDLSFLEETPVSPPVEPVPMPELDE